jgi:hypothetical protein
MEYEYGSTFDLKKLRQSHKIHGIEYINDLEQAIINLNVTVQQLKTVIRVDRSEYSELYDRYRKVKEENEFISDDLHREEEYNKAISETIFINGNLVAKYEEKLREIDTHIRATSDPIPYIIQTLKETLPEYEQIIMDET